MTDEPRGELVELIRPAPEVEDVYFEAQTYPSYFQLQVGQRVLFSMSRDRPDVCHFGGHGESDALVSVDLVTGRVIANGHLDEAARAFWMTVEMIRDKFELGPGRDEILAQLEATQDALRVANIELEDLRRRV